AGEPLGLLHPGQRAVGGLDCRPGEHRSVGARQVPVGPGTDELRCAGAWEVRVLRQPAVIAAGPPRALLVWRVVVGVVLFHARLRGRRVLGWRRDGLGPRGSRPSRRAAALGSATAVMPGQRCGLSGGARGLELVILILMSQIWRW